MITRNIKCAECGHEGKVEALDTVDTSTEYEIFKHLGKDPSGYLYFHCPSCNSDIGVDTLKVFGKSQMVGYKNIGQTTTKNRHVPVIWGLIYLAIALFIIFKFSGWLSYLIGGFLFMLSLVSLKTGLFASDKEISELTNDGPVSKETKRKFQERI